MDPSGRAGQNIFFEKWGAKYKRYKGVGIRNACSKFHCAATNGRTNKIWEIVSGEAAAGERFLELKTPFSESCHFETKRNLKIPSSRDLSIGVLRSTLKQFEAVYPPGTPQKTWAKISPSAVTYIALSLRGA